MLHDFNLFNGSLQEINSSKMLITTLNAHSYNTLKNDNVFREALLSSDVLLPDGISVVLAVRFLKGIRIKKIAGDDLFRFEMQRIHNSKGKCFFLGSSENTLHLIQERAEKEYPELKIHCYPPPYKTEFNENENQDIINAINEFEPDVLFIGMTAPKQEKWAYKNFEQLKVGHICCIGAVFDFYAGTVRRAPEWMIKLGLEWFYRLQKEPRRLWRRYLVGNFLFVSNIIKEKFLILHLRKKLNDLNTDDIILKN
ncbi:MAG: WecB/TagA/CpsF family glycosyltransferase [Dysgonamonadaceae bacterium]